MYLLISVSLRQLNEVRATLIQHCEVILLPNLVCQARKSLGCPHTRV